MKNLKLFLWEGVLCDYTDGVIFAIAEDLAMARKTVINKYSSKMIEEEITTDPKVYTGSFAFALHGGG